jgi:hypothetical protein
MVSAARDLGCERGRVVQCIASPLLGFMPPLGWLANLDRLHNDDLIMSERKELEKKTLRQLNLQ